MYVDLFLPLISTPKYFGLHLVKVAEKEVRLLRQMSHTVCCSHVTVKPRFYLLSQTPVLGFVCPGSYTHTQTVENQSPLRVISVGDASHALNWGKTCRDTGCPHQNG